MDNSTSIVWFRNDLRISDNPALTTVLSQNRAVVPVFIHDATESKWSHGVASQWWLGHSLRELDAQLRAAESRLIMRRGKPADVLKQLAEEIGTQYLYYNRRYDPHGIQEQKAVERLLKRNGVAVQSFNASLLFEPELIRNRKGEPFRVFTPFWHTCLESPVPAAPLPAPSHINPPERWPAGETIQQLGLEERNGGRLWKNRWSPGAGAATKTLKRFTARGVRVYATDRDRPDKAGTSRLSPHLHFGEISPHQVWYTIRKSISGNVSQANKTNARAYLRQLGWREFAHYLLYHFPFTADKPLRAEYQKFPWKHNGTLFGAWCEGRTGYPIVDAGMRELANTGWMHNRVRMVAASFLVKDLLIPWQRGAQWFWDNLVDADLGNNTLGWQWVAGCGADAAPFFRIFNPVSQGKKFDPEGLYVRTWVRELKGLPSRWIHCPWHAPLENLEKAGVQLDGTYPSPIIDHAVARQRALSAYDEIKRKK